MTAHRQTILVFSDDWGRHPSSCQHLVTRLLQRHSVLWVNTIGMRAPHFNLLTVKRGFEKLRQWTRKQPPDPVSLPEHLQVLNPTMWPWMRTAFDRSLNRRLLAHQLLPHLRACDPPAVAITTVPVVADLVGVLPVRSWLYYCVDDFSAWPGLDQAALARLERDLVTRVECCVAVSENLQERLAGMGAASHLLTHGVDVDFWAHASPDCPLPAVEGSEEPLIVFWGLKDRRLDVEFLRRLSENLHRGTILLVGPENEPDPLLKSLPRVRSVGVLPFDALRTLGARAAVLIMPYADLPVTRAMQPLKLKEYLATGRPVIARGLPALQEWADCVDLVNRPDEFVQAVLQRLESGLPSSQRLARDRLAGESWQAKADQLQRWLLPDAQASISVGAAEP
jgi:glycosyltransferase involved in cell wall biosynthesis